MKHTYHIHGMTCNGCRSHVEETLSEVAGVKKAGVDLEKGEATIEMESHIPIETFQDALQKDGGKYSIHTPGDRHHHHSDHNSKRDMIMKHEYSIQGMTCNGCRSHVEETLSKVAGVKEASVNLEKGEATIEMESHIPIETFQDALQKGGGRYSIHPQGSDHHHHPMHEEKKKTQRQRYRCVLLSHALRRR